MTAIPNVVEVHFYPTPGKESPDPMTWVMNYTYLGKTRRPSWIDETREYEFVRKLASIVKRFVSVGAEQTVSVRGWAFGGVQRVMSGVGYAYKNTHQILLGGTGHAFDEAIQTIRSDGANAYAYDETEQAFSIAITSPYKGKVQHYGSTRPESDELRLLRANKKAARASLGGD